VRIGRGVVTLSGAAALCWLLANTGCGVVSRNSAAVSSSTAGGATSSGGSVTAQPVAKAKTKGDWAMSMLFGGSAGIGMFPAKFTFDVHAAPDCTNDFVAYNTNLSGGDGEANIIAFNQIYSTQRSVGGLCNQMDHRSIGPTSRGDAAATSVVLSGDGATLRILKWKAGEGTAIDGAVAPTTTLLAGQNWATDCPAGNSCLSSIEFNGFRLDTLSAPFYNYSADTLYVGDDDSFVHKFTGIFNGTAAEVTAGWPIQVNGTANLSSPVFDGLSGNIFVGDDTGRLSYIREVGSSVGTGAAGSRHASARRIYKWARAAPLLTPP
jgi:hypothetical protein